MIYQSTIQIKGKEKLISVSKKAATAVAEIYNNKLYEGDHPINIANKIFFRKGDIKNIEIMPDIERMKTEVDSAGFYAEEKVRRDAILRRDAKSRSTDLEMFRQFYIHSVGDEPTPELYSQARGIQERFFIKNPKRTVCDPMLFKAIIYVRPGKRITIWASGMFRAIESAVLRDMQLAK